MPHDSARLITVSAVVAVGLAIATPRSLATAVSVILPAGCSGGSSSEADAGKTPEGGKTREGGKAPEGGRPRDAGKDSGGVPTLGFAWAESFQAGFGSNIYAMTSDATSVVIVGQIVGAATFGSTKLVAEDSTGNAFVAKLDPMGKVLWAQIATGNNSDFEAVTIDSAGNVIVSGEDFGDGPGFTFGGSTLAPNTGKPIGGKTPSSGGGVLVEMDSSGSVMWSKYVDTTGEVNMSSLAVGGGSVFVAGPIIDDADFSNGGGPDVLGCGTKGCVFLAIYDTSGNIQSAVIAPSTPHRGTGVDPREVWIAATSSHVTMAIGGYYSSAGGETNDTKQLVVNQYDLMGKLLWSQSAPDKRGSPGLNGLAVDAMDNAYVGGDLSAGLQLGPLKDTNDQYVARFSSSGSVTWAIQNKGVGALGLHSLALGDHIYTFGNGGVGSPPGGTSMTVDVFDTATGSLVARAPCSAAHGIGLEVTTSTAGVFVSGQGGPTGTFGSHKLTAAGLFVAKLE